MAVQHSTLTDPELHEPKGISGAGLDTVYHANGAGSGTWKSALSTLNNANKVFLSARIADISTASSTWTVAPLAGEIDKVYVVLFGSITTANANVTIELGGTPVAGLQVVCAYAGSTAGSVFNDEPSGSAAVTEGQAIEIITDGASDTAMAAEVIIVLDVA